MSKEIFRLEDIGFKVNNQQILENISLTVHKGDIVTWFNGHNRYL